MTEAEKTIETTTETETDTPKTDNEHQRKLNVGNLASDVTEEQLREYFSGHEIEKVNIFHYRKYAIALLLFKDKEAATNALLEKNRTMFQNRRLRIHLEYITIRHIKREFVVTVVDDENVTEEQLWDKVKAAGVEPSSILIFYPLGYITLEKDVDKLTAMDKLKKADFNVHDVNQRDQNQHLDILRAAKLFYRNRNRLQLLNIPAKWIEDKEEMKKQCAEGGTITEAVANNVNQSSSNYARIFYETEEQAIKAAAALNGRIFEDKRIHAIHLGSALIPNYKTSVYVTPLEKTTTEEQVYDHFKQFGEIDFVNRRNCIDSAIICYKNGDSVEKALACKTFPAPTEEKKDATKEITVNKYDGPLVIRPSLKRKLQNPDGTPIDLEKRNKDQKDVLEKLQAFHPIFVGNVPMNCPPMELKRYFAQAGPIKFMFSPQILTYRAAAPYPVKTFIIYYQLRANAFHACKNLDHKFFGGHRLHVIQMREKCEFEEKKTVKITKIPYLSEDALFKKIKPFVGKINRIVKKNRLAAYVELNDVADVEKFIKTDTADHPFPKAKIELIKGAVNVRLYNEDDPRVLNGIAKIVSKNPDMLTRTPAAGPINKRPRLQGPGAGGFNRGPGGYNNNNNMNNPQAIQDLLRLAFMSGKNVGESLASNQGSFDSDPPLSNSNNFGDGGFRNRNNQGGQNNFRTQGRNMNQNQNQNRTNTNFANNSAGGNTFQNRGQNNSFNQNRGNQPNNQNNQQQNRSLNLNQGQNRMQQNNQGQSQNRNNLGGGNNLNRNQNQNLNRNQNRTFDNDSFSGSNNFGNNRSNNFANDNFSNDNFGNNFSNDNFGNNRNNFGGNNRNQSDSSSGFNSSFGNKNTGGGNNRFGNNDGGQFNNFSNRNNQNNFDDNFGNNQKNNTFNQNRQNKPFNNNSGGNQGGGSFNDFNNANRNSGGFNSGNNTGGGNKWSNNSNSQQTNTGSRLAGSIFSRRF